MATIKIKQVRSKIKCPNVQKLTLEALGLKKMHASVIQRTSPTIMGMVKKLNYLLKVEEVSQP